MPHQEADSLHARIPHFDLQGHRGAQGLAPENTLGAFELACRLGVTTLELDASVTSDRIVVVTHDRRLNPDITRDEHGQWLLPPTPTVYSMRFVEIERLDVGRINPKSMYARRFPAQIGRDGIRMPSLASVFERFKDAGVRFSVETKLSPLAPEETPSPVDFAKLLYEVIWVCGVEDRCAIQSFDWRTLLCLKEIDSCLRLSFLTSRETSPQGVASPWTAGFQLLSGGSISQLVCAASRGSPEPTWSPEFKSISSFDVREARELGLAVVPWTLNDPDDMQLAIDWGVAGFITDYPDIARVVLWSNGLGVPSTLPNTMNGMSKA